jgi:hypothetical protein
MRTSRNKEEDEEEEEKKKKGKLATRYINAMLRTALITVQKIVKASCKHIEQRRRSTISFICY